MTSFINLRNPNPDCQSYDYNRKIRDQEDQTAPLESTEMVVVPEVFLLLGGETGSDNVFVMSVFLGGWGAGEGEDQEESVDEHEDDGC